MSPQKRAKLFDMQGEVIIGMCKIRAVIEKKNLKALAEFFEGKTSS